MDQFKEQLNNNLKNDINKFNNNPEYAKIRDLYKLHFEIIKGFVQKAGNKPAIEDIANLDSRLTSSIVNHILLLKEINRAISTQQLKLSDIK